MSQEAFVAQVNSGFKKLKGTKGRKTSDSSLSRFLNHGLISFAMAKSILATLYKDEWRDEDWENWLEPYKPEPAAELSLALPEPEPYSFIDMNRSVKPVNIEQIFSANETPNAALDVPQELPTLDIQPIGRDKALEDIHNALTKTSRVIVTGMPGVGKSLVALYYAHHAGRAYPGGTYWIDAPDGGIARQIVELTITQGVVVPDTIEPFKQFRYCTNHWPLASQPVLLVLDNVEAEEELLPILKWLPAERFKLLITSRPQMRLANMEQVPIPVLPTAIAVLIIRQILPADDRRLANASAALADLCGDLLGGLPLALQIVGQALKENSYLDIINLNKQLRAVGNPFAGTGLTDVDMADMLESVRQGVMAVFEISWQALPVDSQLLAGLISLYAPVQVPWSLIQAAAQSVEGIEKPAAACAKLRQMSLLQRTGRESYQMHRLLRSFFQLKIQSVADAKKATHEALLNICRKVPERCNQVDAKDFIPIEPHAIAAIDEGMHDRELYQSLQCYFVGQGLYQQAYAWAEKALERYQQSADINIEHLARLRKQVGERAHLSALYEIALDHLEVAHELLKDSPPSQLLAEVLVILSAALRAVGANDEAETMSLEALRLCEQFFEPDSLEISEAKLTQATAMFVRLRDARPPVVESRFTALEEDVQSVIDVREQKNPDDQSSIAEAYNLLAKILEKTSRLEAAIALYQKAVELTHPPHVNAASARNNLAKALEGKTDNETVINLYQQAITIFGEAGQEGDQGWCQHNLGMFYDAQGFKEVGIPLVETGLKLMEQSNHPGAAICAERLANMRNSN